MVPHDYLRTDEFASLFAANDPTELIVLANALAEGAAIWALLRPTDSKMALLTPEGHEGLDPLPAGQIAGIRIPVGSQVAPASVPWAKSLVRFLEYQNERMGETATVLPVWESGALIAITGASKAMRSTPGLLQGIGLAMRRLHQVTELRRDMEGARYLLPRSEKLVVLATLTGKILLGTTGGLAVIDRLTSADRKDVLPIVLRKAIEEESRQVVMGDIQANLSRLTLNGPATVFPLVSVRFSRRKRKDKGFTDLAAALQSLTPAENKVYPLLKEGLRDKEIADQLSLSYHTAKHHVSHILSKLGCSDRLLLIARAAKSLELPPTLTNPIPPPLPKVAALPLPKVRSVSSVQVSDWAKLRRRGVASGDGR